MAGGHIARSLVLGAGHPALHTGRTVGWGLGEERTTVRPGGCSVRNSYILVTCTVIETTGIGSRAMVRFKGLGEYLLLIERENIILQSITLRTLQDTSGSPGTKLFFMVHADQLGPARIDQESAGMASRI